MSLDQKPVPENAEPENAIVPRPGDSTTKDPIVLRAVRLAERHTVSDQPQARLRLYNRLKTQRLLLHDAYLLFVRLSELEEIHSFAAEWLLDNYYIVQQAMRQILEDMPAKFYRQLPKLSSTRLAGNPRVYALALELVYLNDARIDTNFMEQFVNAYQTASPLTMGELWALPVMLRFSIIEALTQAAIRVLDIGTLDEGRPGDAVSPDISSDTVVANCIISLRTLATYDWKAFFEKESLVERVLERDPAQVYAKMEFETRDQYRKVIEDIALEMHHSEVDLARIAIRLAREAQTQNGQADEPGWRKTHVGYYLVDKGLNQFKAAIGYRGTAVNRLTRWLLDNPTAAYLGLIGIITGVLALLLGLYNAMAGATLLQLLLVLLIALVPITGLSVNLVNWLVTYLIPPRLLPKLDFSRTGATGGIPDEARTIVVIPAMLTSEDEVDSLVQQLELHFLRNDDKNLFYALLTDFTDAETQHTASDERLLRRAINGIEALRERYRQEDGREVFFFLNRERRWNPKESAWMGWERKRGKLEEFNRLLLRQDHTSFTTIIGDLNAILPVRYVITLDADTLLPQGAAERLIGTLAHPLNRAEFDPHTGRVTAGYTILQPRTEVKPTSVNQTNFTRIYASDSSFDLYTHAVSDVYQDLFGEGIFVGKGIYDIEAFSRSVNGQIPENTLLSHDLLEGLLGRAGLVSDITLYEDYPPNYLAFINRLLRWIRGDWQLLPWLLGLVNRYEKEKRPLTTIDRWKIIDNLRRSLFAPSLMLLLVLGWLWLPGPPLFWTAFVLLLAAGPAITNLVDRLLRKPQENIASAPRLTNQRNFVRWLLCLVFLAFESIATAAAILITLVRVFITRRKLLEWTPSASIAQLFKGLVNPDLIIWREMFISPVIALITGLLIVLGRPSALLAALPFLLSWLAAPQVAVWLSQPIVETIPELRDDEVRRLRSLARRTWYFFEKFVGPVDHWLPPDHFQEAPRGTVAHRTSTTNIGLGLLSTLAAYDLGYTSLQDLILRLRSTMATLDRLEMYRGHFMNWYDTRTLAPLPPRYISTVDNGNLAASMITLRQALLEIPDQPVQRWQNWEGLLDTLCVFYEAVESLGHRNNPGVIELLHRLDELIERIQSIQDSPEKWGMVRRQINEKDWSDIEGLVLALISGTGSEEYQIPIEDIDPTILRSLRLWTERVRYSLTLIHREQQDLAPWIAALVRPPRLFQNIPGDEPLGNLWQSLLERFSQPVTLRNIERAVQNNQATLEQICQTIGKSNLPPELAQEAVDWCSDLQEKLPLAVENAQNLLKEIDHVSRRLDMIVEGMDFKFLYDPQRAVFHIGYNLDAERMDNNYYDLLASEARIASLIAIAKHDVPLKHWLYLARPLTFAGGSLALLSWSGTMFEYLMPSLMVREYPGTLLRQSSLAAIEQQIAYGRENDVPWGISESGFYFFDQDQNYQYRAFGVPGLGLKRGLSEDLVITPYASLLALIYRPREVLENMQQLDKLGTLADYGYYEAIDFTTDRMPIGKRHAVVQSFMAHHQGMILLQIANLLHDRAMVRRFHSSPKVQSVDLLLQEQVPDNIATEHLSEEIEEAPANIAVDQQIIAAHWRVPVDHVPPQAHYLSNGRFSTMITNLNSGYSQWGRIALTRWRADSTLDHWGTWIYLQDLESGEYWTAGTKIPPPGGSQYEVFFAPHEVNFISHVRGINMQIRVTVPPEDDIELRRVRISNVSNEIRRLALTSYGEVVLTEMDNDRRHPAFNKMVVESEFHNNLNALIFHRRPRAAGETPNYLLHGLIGPAGELVRVKYESDRSRFLGRGRTPREPLALDPNGPGLTGKTGYVLDPVFALRYEIDLVPHSSIEVTFITTASDSRQKAINLARDYQDWSRIDRAFEQARYAAEIEMRRMDIDAGKMEQYQKLLSMLFYPQLSLRAHPEVLAANRRGQPALWAYAISGDYPILLVNIAEPEEVTILRDLLRAHAYWRTRGLLIDLVILNEKETGYSQDVHDRIFQLLLHTNNDTWLNRRGGIFILRKDSMSQEDLTLLRTAARVIIDGSSSSLEEQIANAALPPMRLPLFQPVEGEPGGRDPLPPVDRPAVLQFDNGYGGFSPDEQEYIIYLEPGRKTPMPWINVIANENAGFLVSESGGGYTWAGNSGENRLTPWQNDPVTDMPGEALYLRDEESAEIWSPTPMPAGEDTPFLVRHGAGYTIFEHNSHGLNQQLRLFVPREDPLKIIELRLENRWKRQRRITVTYYAEWVLGVNRDQMAPYIIPEYEHEHCALLARNPYMVEFAERVAFLTANQEPHGVTADRTEFLGYNRSYRRPAALERVGLSGTVQPGLDPCAAIQLHIDLEPGETREISFLLGQSESRESALFLMEKYSTPESIHAAFDEVTSFWDDLLSTVQVATPDPAMNIILNRWLLYQDLSCRIWGRSGLYQSSGAYGFRDQLQDVMALIHAAPEICREQIVRAAHYQFVEGDVLHWWHPPSGRGVRTKISDDLLWLPFVTAEYLAATGDRSVLEEQVPFLVGPELREDEEDRYGEYLSTEERYSIYEHCRRAIIRGSTSGLHGIPLMGAGDWNDGMNRVGIEGKGESVWLGWFLYAVLERFAPICSMMGDEKQAESFIEQARQLRDALNENTWDGDWYLRGFFDNGQPLGSRQSDECKIDSIPQSWSVISGGGKPDLSRQAMESVRKILVQQEGRLLRLFTPPFNRTQNDPGYIKAYPPGVRENGGQYTHAATWAVWAFAMLGQGDTAGELYQMLNPITHGSTPGRVAQYQVEPYVIAADVYSEPPHVGHGGWTWYTGSAGWMYRLGIEAILGLRRIHIPGAGDRLIIDPCIPSNWPGFEAEYRFNGTVYRIRVENPDRVNTGVGQILLDGVEQNDLSIPLQAGGGSHHVLVRMEKGSQRPGEKIAEMLRWENR